MRITFLNPVGVVGGAERVLLAALRGTRAHWPEAELRLVLLAEGPLQAEARALGVSVDVVPLPARLVGLGDTQLRGESRVRVVAWLGWQALLAQPHMLGYLGRLRRALRQYPPDLIHSNGLKTHTLATFARPRGVPVVWHLHDFYSLRPVMARALNRCRAGVRAGVAISEAVKRDAAAVAPGLPITVVRNAVDTDNFSPAPGDGAALDRLAGLPPATTETLRVGLVATYANWKGQDVFLDALTRLPSSVRGFIIGGPIYATEGSQFTRAELEQRVAANGLVGRVGFVPFQADPVACYRALDVAIHSSVRPEPFGLTVAEAMSCGKPVVVAAAGGAVELFTEGVDALGHPPGDPAALATAIARLAADAALRTRLGAAARQTAAARFSLERYGRELVEVYRAVMPLEVPRAERAIRERAPIPQSPSR